MSSILILFLISYFILAKIRLDWAVMLLIAALPSYLIRFSVLGIPFTLLEAMILISFVVWFFKDYKGIFRNLKLKIGSIPQRHAGQILNFNRYPFDIEIILLLIISFIAIAVAGFSDSALGIWKAYFFEPVLVFILIFNVFGRKFAKRLHSPNVTIEPSKNGKQKELSSGYPELSSFCGVSKILWPLATSAFTVSVFAIYQKFTGAFIFNELWAAEETRRVVSFFGYPNAVGLYLGPIVLIMIGWLMQKSKVKSQKSKVMFIGLTIILSLLSIYFAKSEGALVGVAAGIIVFCLLAGKKIRWATALLIFIIGTGIMVYQPTRDYAVKKMTLQDLSGEIRKQQWEETWQMMAVSPSRFIFGAGLANYQNVIAPHHQEGIFFNKDNDPEFHRHVVWNEEYKKSHWQPVEIYMYPHNIFLNFWTELGLAGMLLFVWIIGKFFVIGIKNIRYPISDIRYQVFENKYITIGLMCSMITITIHGLVDVPYFKNDLAVMFFILVAMMGIINLECFKKND